MTLRSVAWMCVCCILACGGKGAPASQLPADTVPPAVVPADSLVLTLGEGTEVRLTAGRMGTGTDGAQCREYGVRVGERLVPLLFVRAAPRLEGGILRAELSRDCRVVATYRIDPVTAQPTLERGR